MKLLCLDSNSILNRAFYGVKLLTTKDGTYTNAIFGFMNILQKLLNDVQPDAVICAFDLRAPTFRHKMYDGYKAQRKGMPEELAQQLPLVKELLTDLGYRIVTREGYEADDILGTFSAECEREGHDCFIATGDRDSLQLIGPHTKVLLASSKMGRTETIVCDETYFEEKYGTTPIHLIDIKALMGDSSDNIPGVAGIGEKTALKLIGQYTDIETIYENLDSIEASPSIKKKLEAGRESAFMSKTLATIDRSVELEVTIEECVPRERDEQAAFELLSRLEMNSLIKKLGLTGEYIPVDLPQKQTEIQPVHYVNKSITELLESAGKEAALSVMVSWKQKDSEEIESIAVCAGGEIILHKPEQGALYEQELVALFESENPKILFDCKSVYHWTLHRGCGIKNLRDDILLSAYLVSVNSTEYSIEKLCAGYHTKRTVENAAALEEADVQLLESCASLLPLHEVLSEQLAESGQEKLLREIELPLSEVLASMELYGFEVDAEAIAEYGKMLEEKIEEYQNLIYQLAGESFNINSPKQLGEVLFEHLGLPAKKKTKTGYSTNAEVLESLRGKHEIIDGILEYRKVSKLKSTYVDGLLKVIGKDGRIHSHFNQTDTRTGRLSSTEPNLQNIPVRTELGSRLREFFRAKEGCRLVDADYSQIELRVLAHISNDAYMIDAFNSDADIHTNTAAQVFNMPELFVTPEMRRKAKAVNFGIVYGIGAFSLSQDIGVSVAEADKYIKNYLDTYSGVRQYMEDTVNFAKENGYVATMFGRRRPLPEITASNKNIVNFGKRVAMNTPIQGTAADIIKIAMIKVYHRLQQEGLSARLILQVHDELIVEAPEHEVETVRKLLCEEMQNAVQMKVVLKADVGDGKTWLEAK